MRFLCLCFLLVGCGGKIDGDDGGTSGVDSGTQKDGSSTLDVSTSPPACTPISGGGTVSSDGSCSATAAWSCGDTKYSVECSCPSNQCTCTQQSGSVGSGTIVTPQSLCPGCSSNLPALCGFPTK